MLNRVSPLMNIIDLSRGRKDALLLRLALLRLAQSLAAFVLLLATAFVASEPVRAEESSKSQWPAPEKLELRYQGWSGRVLYPELAEDLGYLAPVKLKWIGNTISGPQDIQAAVTGDIDFGGAFNGSILKLAAAHAPIKAVIAYIGTDAQTSGGLLTLNSSPIQNATDLVGRKIGVNTPGAYQEYLITVYLQKSGVSAEDIKKVIFVPAPPVNLAQLLRAKQLDAIFLEDILKEKVLAEGDARLLVTDYGLLGSFGYAAYILTDRFIAQYPGTSRKFVEATARAIAWAQSTPREEVIARLEKILQERNRNEDRTAVRYWKSASVGGKGGVIRPEEFESYQAWFEANGQLKPGQIRAADVYTNRFNPFAD
ncbi:MULTISPECIES: ABC transporter substrate-binding protein [Bradyrhizobium]|jgi:ABC-type nitrate/sulfonate/bicarbonate transport system substrate-binding protein|uniref:ABC transporter substrate-binding protein n=1 Tax=Bradyrhizobium TaxID=374 RepID=UPI00005E0711|nr:MULTISPECIES: ABC transporter substrate-binding protein [Bradyrhizobium]ABQ33600.1 Putative aliphatic sulfonates uptake ABC transporter periplasmic solute-binding protein precursor [Bradyrhizobium sp. BTAi1]MCL8487206.1 ABC transporter substrate-binding protein [Bradyrhizobium denitrificans]